jgi:hypothetical protein
MGLGAAGFEGGYCCRDCVATGVAALRLRLVSHLTGGSTTPNSHKSGATWGPRLRPPANFIPLLRG